MSFLFLYFFKNSSGNELLENNYSYKFCVSCYEMRRQSQRYEHQSISSVSTATFGAIKSLAQDLYVFHEKQILILTRQHKTSVSCFVPYAKNSGMEYRYDSTADEDQY